ncbi:flagellin [Priestia megaterium]|uniref:flagellin n=1 Tax=Priestia megaterium TaxID=1404 RepID=UPI002E23AF84|nr:flagellin [Priestia megaterium]
MYIRTDQLNLQLLQQQKLSLKIINQSTEKIASNSRINQYSDDIGALTVSSQLNSLLRANAQGISNTQDGINLLNVMDSGSSTIKDMVQHLHDLIIKNQDSSLSQADKSALQLEFKQTISNIQDIAENTKYANKSVLNNTSIQLNGSNMYVDMGLSYRGIATTNHTLETTFTIDKLPTDKRAFIYGFEGKHHAIELNPDGSLMFQTWFVDSSGTATSNTVGTKAGFVKEGETYKAIGVIDTDNRMMRFYVNGSEVGNLAIPADQTLFDYTTSYWGNLRVGIGNNPGGSFDYPFSGTVSSGKLYNSALSSSQITSAFNGKDPSNGILNEWTASNGKYNTTGTVMNGATYVNDKIGIRSGASIEDKTQIELANLSAKGLSLYSLSIDDTNALQTVDSALSTVLSTRSNIGAQLNAMNFRQQQLYSSFTSSTKAVDNIFSVDTAKESSVISKEQMRLQTTLTMIQNYNDFKLKAVKLLNE